MFWLIKKSLQLNTFFFAAEVQYKRKCQAFYPKQINVTQARFYYVGSCMYCVSLEMKHLVSDAKRIVLLKIT